MNTDSILINIDFDQTQFDVSLDRTPRTFRILEVHNIHLGNYAKLKVINAILRNSPVCHLVLFPAVGFADKALPRQKVPLVEKEIMALVQDNLAPPRIWDRLEERPTFLGSNVYSILDRPPDLRSPGNLIKEVLRDDPESLRISCGSMCRIKIDDNLLLGLNKTGRSKGSNDFTPIGGGIQVSPCGQRQLKDVLRTDEIIFDKKPPHDSWCDLRFTFQRPDSDRVNAFLKWFGHARETGARESNPMREILEELAADDGHHVKAFDPKDVYYRISD